jgi:hypothetical protein
MKKKEKEDEAVEDSKRKGIDMLRLDRKLAPILDAWREAKQKNPGEWP